VTPLRISIASTAVAVVLLLVVFELIRSRRLRERYALLWLATGLVLTALAVWRSGLNTIAPRTRAAAPDAPARRTTLFRVDLARSGRSSAAPAMAPSQPLLDEETTAPTTRGASGTIHSGDRGTRLQTIGMAMARRAPRTLAWPRLPSGRGG